MFAQTRMWGHPEMAQRLESLTKARELRQQQKSAGPGQDAAAAPILPGQLGEVVLGDQGPYGDARLSVPSLGLSSIFHLGTGSEAGVNTSKTDRFPPEPRPIASHGDKNNSNIARKRDKQAPKQIIAGDPRPTRIKPPQKRPYDSPGSAVRTPSRRQGNPAGRRKKQRVVGWGETMREGEKEKANGRHRGVTKRRSRPTA